MTTIKSYTSVEQSNKLAEILPLESADMYYPNRIDIKYQGALPIEYKHGNPLLSQEIAAWSLVALLNNIPQVKIDSVKQYNKKYWRSCVYFASDWHNSDWYDNPVDACYEMILKLKELNLL